MLTCGRASGQSIIESAIALALLCLIFMGLFQISRLGAGQEILHHAAARGSRARTVGFNRWMVKKCVNVAAIPNAGKMKEPGMNRDSTAADIIRRNTPGEAFMILLGRTPPSGLYDVERARIPEYLASENNARAKRILDYEGWDNIHHNITDDGRELEVVVQQNYTNWLWGQVHKAYYGDNALKMTAPSALENHYSLYLNDESW